MSQMCTDILGHPPSLCNCRRVWHPCHTHATSQGVHLSQVHQQSKKCTNKAATASSHSKRLLCILRVPWNNTTQPKHLCASVPSVGGLFRAATPTQGVQLSQLHQPSSHCIFPQNSQNTQKPLAEMYSHRIHRIFLQRRTSVYSACSVGQYYAT